MMKKMSETDKEKTDKEKIDEFSEDSLREIAKEIVTRRLALKIHLVIYLIANILMVYFGVTENVPGLLIPFAGWGVGLVTHTFSYISFRGGWFGKGTSNVLAYHTVIGIATCLLLAWINLVTNNFMEINWAYIPIAAILGSILVHYILYTVAKPKKNEDSQKSYMDRKIEKELKKAKRDGG